MSLKEVEKNRAMRGFSCKRCGNCCRGCGFINVYCEDKEKWKRHGLRHLYTKRMLEEWEDFGSSGLYKNKGSKRCPFLRFNRGKSACAINHVKPVVCRYFPLDRRNAKELDCRGYD